MLVAGVFTGLLPNVRPNVLPAFSLAFSPTCSPAPRLPYTRPACKLVGFGMFLEILRKGRGITILGAWSSTTVGLGPSYLPARVGARARHKLALGAAALMFLLSAQDRDGQKRLARVSEQFYDKLCMRAETTFHLPKSFRSRGDKKRL